MNIAMHSWPAGQAAVKKRWPLAIVGEAVDDRGHAALAYAREHAAEVQTLSYDASSFQVRYGDTEFGAEDLEGVLAGRRGQSLLLEATTLGVVEILLCCRTHLQERQGDISLLYTEPAEYNRPQHRRVLHRRDFELSREVEDFSAVPGFAFMLRGDGSARAVFLVGYEGQRLEQALEQTAIPPSKCTIVFGVPAFQPGWEMDSFANNVPVIQERRLARGTLFAGAQNPAAAYRAIESVYDSREAGERLVVGPIGTKPHGIGASLFVCTHPDVGFLYDHPKRSKKRSERVGSWHLFDVRGGQQ